MAERAVRRRARTWWGVACRCPHAGPLGMWRTEGEAAEYAGQPCLFGTPYEVIRVVEVEPRGKRKRKGARG